MTRLSRVILVSGVSMMLVVARIGTAATPITTPEDDPPSRYTNLQFLPDDITKDELIQTMKFITRSLGTKCKFCHRSDIRDYASDELEKKVIARKMMQMVKLINRELFADRGAPRVTCFMCHRGQLKPPMHP